jgi:pyruvate formate lyase activating enzyme
MNVNGALRSLVYGRVVSVHADPIEKKPFYHFLPGTTAFSFATAGCPLHCQFCQNWEISQAWPEDFKVPFTPPESIVRSASDRQSPIIAFTYNEPTVFTEYMLDVAHLARKEHIRSVLVSCGFMNEVPLADMCRAFSAIKIDLKGYDETFYQKVCGAELKPILRSIKQTASNGVHLEIVNLVVPTLNDSDRMLSNLAEWVHGEVGPDVPIHFTRFHPDYKLLNLPPTPVAILERARSIAMDKGIHYAYVGNVPDHPGNHTYCPGCKKVVIRRQGFFIAEMNLKDGRCAFCRRKIAGIWS